MIELLLTILILSMIALLAVSGMKAVKRNLRAMALQYDAGRMKKQILETIMEDLRYAGEEDMEELIYQTADFSGLRVCPLDEELPILQWEPETSCVRISFGICDEEGRVLESVKNLRIRVWNIGGANASLPTASLPSASVPGE